VKRDARDHGGASQRPAAAITPVRAPDASSRVLQLQRTIGNRATGQLLQRWDVDDVIDVLGGPLVRHLPAGVLTGGAFDLALNQLFATAVAYGRAKATTFPIPKSYDDKLDQYAAANPADGKILKKARDRKPTFHRGGLVPDDALAMTMDTDIFCKPTEPTVDTYIHELVHVWQYGEVGPAQFLQNLLGGAAVGVLTQLIQGKSVDIMKASPYEMQAYGVECRFKKWAGYSLPDGYCDAQGHPL
jgi:hypothetical protein